MDNNNMNGEFNNTNQNASQQGEGTRPYQNFSGNSQSSINTPNDYNNFSGNNTPNQGGYAAQVQFEEPMTIGEWLIIFLISMIPCVNIIMLFVWAFSQTEKKSKSNYCKASLIWALIWSVLSIVIFIAISASMIPLMESLSSGMYY